MAAPSGHDKMAAEVAGEYMQVVVGGGLEPGQQVMVLQGSAGEEMRAANISTELLQTIAHTDTVYYVQPDGTLVPGGTLAEVTGGEGAIGAPVMMDAALQLKNVADHVALKQGAPSQVSRILHQKQLKSICVQVPGLKPKESSESVTVQENPSTPVNVSADNTSVVTAQVVQAKAVPPPSQPFVVKAMQQPSVVKAVHPPVQILIQHTPVQSTQVNTPDADGNEAIDSAEEHGCCVAHHQYSSCAPGTAKKGQKRKKAIKIKTRSGRISRPPKHKAKDYKFLKVGDSIQDSSGDSEDSSEPSTEDEEGGGGGKERAPRDRQPYAVKNSLFQCQKCEKSYMGKGGLFRHYRLYPAHGQMDPLFVLEAKKSVDGGGTGEQKKPTPRPRKRLLEDPANPSVSNQQTLSRDGLEITSVMTPYRGRRQMSARKFGHPRKILRNGTVEEHARTVKDLIQQCEEKDLKEQVAPSLTKLLSVYDFLLLKVKQEQVDNKPLFPYVYREFEKLHFMVKSLAEDYVINMDQNVEKPLEVTDSKVAETLGISKEMTVNAASSSSVTAEQQTQIEEHNESSDEELMPPAKRLKIGDEDSKDEAENMTTGIAETAQSGGPGQHDNNEVVLLSSTDPGTASEEVEQETSAAINDVLVEVTESLQVQTDTEPKYDSQESLPSPYSTDASQSQEHPLNLSCQLTEEILNLQTRIDQNDTKETGEAEPSANLPVACDDPEPADPEVPCDSSLASIDCSQVVDHTRTILTTSVPTTLAEAMCREVPQVSFVEVGGALIPTTNTFTTGSLNMSGVTPTFSLNQGHELVFIHNTEETATEEAVVIFDNTGGVETNLDTVVALVEM
ncbi:PREDICTED: zinc finger protein 839 [Nanorana parkeri]|uniref:zinc finger protein 839 n=1 Tax=Nanorana parkeri TaxID=125878 RepID=UPI00085496A4|nr:PREDICTED: zinc finger protein 839 [Nanorana parkeri]